MALDSARLPLHCWVLQARSTRLGPRQEACCPSQARERVCTPPPQGTEQGDQTLQSPQLRPVQSAAGVT